MKVSPGGTLGRFQIVGQIGRGGMATVYKAYQPSLDRTVAIKVLPEFFAEDEEFRERFQQEAVAVARLRHPSIVTVFEYGEESGVTYIASQLVDGGTLHDRLGAPMPVADAVRVLAPIASALDYAHGRGVLHRDVKPGNVLVTTEGVPVLTDFGLAKMLDSGRHLTKTGSILGTPEYMAPEQCDGLEVTPASDQYSLAVIAFQLLTGSTPFSGATPMEVIVAQMRTAPPPARQLNPALSPKIEAALRKGLAKAPKDRFASCSDLVGAIGAELSSPADAATPKTQPAAPAPARRMPRTAMIGGAILLLALLGAGALVATRPPARFPSPAPTPIPKLVRGPLIYEAKLDASDVNPPRILDPSAASMTPAAGNLAFTISKPGGSVSATLRGTTAVVPFISELEVAADQGASLHLWWTTGGYSFDLDAAKQTVQVITTPANPSDQPAELGPAVPVPALRSGQKFTLDANIQPNQITLFLDQRYAATVTLPVRTAGGSQPAFAAFGSGGSIHVTGVREYNLP